MSDFLFSIGVDSAQADAAVQEFVKRSQAALETIQKVQFASNAGAKAAIDNQQKLLNLAQQRLSLEEKIASAQSKGRAGAAGAVGGITDISAVATRNASAIGKQKDALDFLNRIMGNTVFKFVEYEIVMKAFNGLMHEVMNSLNEASNVQLEQTLQHLYNAQIDVNAALKDAIIIAKQWGSNITDVQQVIGLWTKQTSQMHDATGKLVDSQTALAAAAKLAADAEKFHRASGIESLEVYEKTVSMWHELGLSLGQIPGMYDKISYAATKISSPLKQLHGGGSQESIKDIFEGVTEAGATLRGQGMDDALIIATIAKQVENLGTTGSKTGNLMNSMFASLNQGGKPLQEWVNILGADAFKDSEHFMDAAIAKVEELKKAQAHGDLHVKPYTENTWRTFLETLEDVKKLADEIRGHSAGMLDKIAGAQMDTYQGQVARLGASFQQLNLALGTQLLPTATRFVQFLSGSLMPALAAHSGAVIGSALAIVKLAGAYGIALVGTRVIAMLQGIAQTAAAASTQVGTLGAFQGTAAASANVFANEELRTVGAIQDAKAQMVAEQQALQMLQEKLEIVTWRTQGFAAACDKAGVSMEEVSRVAGGGALTGLAAFASGLGGIVAAAVRTLGPLMAIYSVMSAFQNFDKMARINAAVDAGVHEQEGGAKGFFDVVGDMGKSPLLVPDGATANALKARIKANGGADAKTLNDALWTLFNNPKATNDDKTDAGEILKALLTKEYNKLHHVGDIPGYGNIEDLKKQILDDMNREYGGKPAGMTMPGDLTKPKAPKLATEQQIAAEAVNKDKADAMAQISKWRDIANAAGSYAKTLMDVGKANGFTDDLVKKLNNSLYTQQHAVQAGENAAKNEISTLQAQKQHLADLIKSHGGTIDGNGNVHGGDKTSAIYAEAKAWRMAEEAITKAQGKLKGYESQKAKLAQQSLDMRSEATAWNLMRKNAALPHETMFALSGVPGVEGLNPNQNNEGLTSYLQDIKDLADRGTTTLDRFKDSVEALSSAQGEFTIISRTVQDLQKKGLPIPAELVRAYEEYRKEIQTLQKDQIALDRETAAFNKNMRDTVTSIATKDAQGIGKLLGLDDGSLQAQQTLLDGYNSINDTMDKIQGWVEKQAGDYAHLSDYQKSMVQDAVNYLNIQQQLVPLLAQQEQIQSSIAYQAMQTTLEKAGQEQIDQAINRLMGTQSNANVRKQLYDAAKSGNWMSPSQTLLKDYLTNTIGDWWKQQVKQMTNTMFGDPATRARELEQKMLEANRTGLNTIVQDEKTQVVDRLFAWEKQFAADVNKFVSASGGSGGGGDNGGGGGGGDNGGWVPYDSSTGLGSTEQTAARSRTREKGTDANPTVITTVGDGSQGLFSGITSQKNLSKAVADGFDSSKSAQNIKENTGATADAAGSAAQTYQTQQSQYPQYGGSGLLSGLLGPLASIPGLSNYLSKNGSWINGLANAVGGGAGFGTMFGGAGSTNTEWGALGGGVGFGLGMLFGGPAGAQIGGTIGGLFGGLFGHQDNPLDMPDKYDTMNYGKFVANVNGAPGTFNGVTIGPDPQYSIAAGGTPMDRQMYQWAQRNPNDPIAKQLLALGPKLDIASEYQGVFTLGSGKTISVTAYEQLAQQWQAKAGNTSNAPIVSVNSYGGGGAASAYDTPGMSSSEFLAQEQAWAQGSASTSGNNAPLYGGGGYGGGSSGGGSGGGGVGGDYKGYGGGASSAVSPTSTPGFGTSKIQHTYSRGYIITQIAMSLTTPVNLDGKMIAQLVNAYNQQAASSAGAVGSRAHSPYQ